MDKDQLYDQMAFRKFKPKDLEPYKGDNGRVNRCAQLFREKKLKVGGALLDVGGGIGDLAFSIKDLFDKVTVLDISSKNLEGAKAKGFKTLQCDVDKQGLGLKDESLTVVTALDFIEHIIDPENFARECFRVLKSGGDVFVNTPNIQFWQHLESLVKRGVFPHTSGDREVYHGGHLAFYCLDDMQKIFGAAGFTSFRQFKDDEGYTNPPEMFVNFLSPKNQAEYADCCMKLGNPNLLFACSKP